MTEKSRPPLIERVAKVGVLGGIIAGIRLLTITMTAPVIAIAAPVIGFATAEVAAVTVGAGLAIGAAVGGVIYLIDKLAHPKAK